MSADAPAERQVKRRMSRLGETRSFCVMLEPPHRARIAARAEQASISKAWATRDLIAEGLAQIQASPTPAEPEFHRTYEALSAPKRVYLRLPEAQYQELYRTLQARGLRLGELVRLCIAEAPPGDSSLLPG